MKPKPYIALSIDSITSNKLKQFRDSWGVQWPDGYAHPHRCIKLFDLPYSGPKDLPVLARFYENLCKMNLSTTAYISLGGVGIGHAQDQNAVFVALPEKDLLDNIQKTVIEAAQSNDLPVPYAPFKLRLTFACVVPRSREKVQKAASAFRPKTAQITGIGIHGINTNLFAQFG